MATTEAQRRASAKYEAESVRQVKVKLYPRDHDLVEWLAAQESRNAYIVGLIRADMEAHRA